MSTQSTQKKNWSFILGILLLQVPQYSSPLSSDCGAGGYPDSMLPEVHRRRFRHGLYRLLPRCRIHQRCGHPGRRRLHLSPDGPSD